MHQLRIIDTGIMPYKQCWQLQKKLIAKLSKKPQTNYFILTEHPPVITIGKNGGFENLLASPQFLKSRGIELFEIDRGGDITFHGPGQLVGYPILNLEYFKKDVFWYLRTLEQVVIQTLKAFGIKSRRHEKLTGVWVQNAKICAIGIKVTRWMTMHGFALNVNTDLEYFNYIVPCGLIDKSVISIEKLVSNRITVESVKNVLLKQFTDTFGIKLIKQEYAGAQL